MGFRTVVILNNDTMHQWEQDSSLGRKIAEAASKVRRDGGNMEYGKIVEVVHADAESLVHFSSLDGRVVAQDYWHPNKTNEQFEVELLKRFAEKHNLKLVSK